jgi:hypothetical protein
MTLDRMESPLSYKYVIDWRVRSALFRRYVDTPDFVQLSRRSQLKQFAWISFLLFAALLALRARMWLFLTVTAALTIWKLIYLVSLFTTTRVAMFSLREGFRNQPKKEIVLVVDDEGLHETDDGVLSFAPWPSVRSYFLHRRVLGIELENGLWAYLPIATLSPESSSIESLVARLEHHSVPLNTFVTTRSP